MDSVINIFQMESIPEEQLLKYLELGTKWTEFMYKKLVTNGISLTKLNRQVVFRLPSVNNWNAAASGPSWIDKLLSEFKFSLRQLDDLEWFSMIISHDVCL